MSDVATELAMEANDKAMEIARLKSENAELRNDADLLREMLSQVQTEKRCYMSENATLRQQLADATESMGRVEGRCAELRELVRDLYLCSDETCTDCEHHDYSGEGFWCKRGIGWKKARMRELGVEEQ